MVISKLKKEDYQGKRFILRYLTKGYYDIQRTSNGYERIHMDYQNILSNRELSLENKIAKIREYVYEQVKDVDFTAFDDVVFLSKSIGSVEAGILAEKLGVNVI